MTTTAVSRRDFLKQTGSVVVAFNLFDPLGLLGQGLQGGTPISNAGGLSPDQLDSWIAIAPDGSVSVFTSKVDLGTGTGTALGQIVAEELDVPVAKINMEIGEIQHIYKGRAPGNGAVLTTAGDLVFWGDLDGKFRAFDAASGNILWETTLGGSVDNSTISYAVNGKQYIAVMSGEGALTGGLITQAGISPARRHNEMYVFALPDQR